VHVERQVWPTGLYGSTLVRYECLKGEPQIIGALGYRNPNGNSK
jgi:hypothetical protein